MKIEPESSADEPPNAAAIWARRCADGLSPLEQVEFKAWLAADPSHARALARANREGVDCDWAWQTGAVDEILSGVAARVHRKRLRRASLAGVAVLLIGTALVWQVHRTTELNISVPPASTLVVIRPTVKILSDGSVVELKENAQIAADFSGATRAVSLLRGTAYFQVVKDAKRPFVVTATGLSVQALGTAFTVELENSALKVVVAEGKVRVDSSGEVPASADITAEPLVALAAGSGALFSLTPDPNVAPTPRALDMAELQQQLGWRIPKIEFTRTPLREVIAQMNLHNTRKFVLGDESVGNVRVSGVLRADKIETLAETLETDFGVQAERRLDEIILRRAR